MNLVSIQEFRELGLLLEVNRLILHPLGLAMEAVVVSKHPEEPIYSIALGDVEITQWRSLIEWARENAPGWGQQCDSVEQRLAEAQENAEPALMRVRDHREDPEGCYFGDLDAVDLGRVSWGRDLLEARSPARLAALGYIVQPLTISGMGYSCAY